MKENTSGFILMEIIAVVLLIVMMVGSGFYVYQRNHEADSAGVVIISDNKSSEEIDQSQQTEEEPGEHQDEEYKEEFMTYLDSVIDAELSGKEGWKRVSNRERSFELSIPNDWLTVECEGWPGIFIGSSQEGVGLIYGDVTDGSILCGPGNDYPPQLSIVLSKEPNDHFLYGDSQINDVVVAGMQGRQYREISDGHSILSEGYLVMGYDLVAETSRVDMLYIEEPSTKIVGFDGEQKFYEIIETIEIN